jgi:hypothetical protein
MSDEAKNISPDAFTGQWVGETQGWDMPAHLWEIRQQGDYLSIMTRWEGESRSGNFYARILPDKSAFEITGLKNHNIAILIDKQHFVIQGWCSDRTASGERQNSYDVIFSRPGIAELSAKAAYLKSLENMPSDDEKS